MSTGPDRSLRRRLMSWLLGPLLLVSAALSIDSYRSAREAADLAYDGLIAASALAIADRVISIDGELDVDLPYVALEMLRNQAQDRVFYRITGTDGALVTGYEDLPPPPTGSAPGDTPVFYDARYRGETVRIARLTQPATGPGASGRFAVQVGQTRGQRDRLARELAVAATVRFAVLLGLIALFTWFGIRVGLEPLARLSRELRSRSPQDLRPLEVSVPREVRDLVVAIDTTMARLSRNLHAMEQFTTDAAHQLRSPLAALHTQVEVALRQQDPAELRSMLTGLRDVTWRTSRLAKQLLGLARSTSVGVESPRERFDLAVLAESVTRAQVATALERDIDLGFECDTGPIPVDGVPVLVEEMLRNVIDNALRYCPGGASVTVRVSGPGDDGHARLEIEDDGAGIPPAERPRALERFYRRPGSTGEGSGLGLAIAQEVARAHGGMVSLHASVSGGLLVRFDVPLATDRDPC